MLAKWLAARYLRPAYPDAFNERLRSVQKALRAFWETHRRELRAAYCRLSTMEELAEEDLYEAEFVLVHPYGDLTQAQAGALVDSFEEICSPCQGLEISGKAMADIDFSLVHLSSYTRWDLDFLSFPDPGASPLPPTEADCE
jgi:hypothetical protein